MRDIAQLFALQKTTVIKAVEDEFEGGSVVRWFTGQDIFLKEFVPAVTNEDFRNGFGWRTFRGRTLVQYVQELLVINRPA